MKKVLALALMFLCVSACAQTGKVDPKKIADYYAGLGGLSAKAQIGANTGVLASYTLAVATEELGTRVSIEQPLSLYGVSAVVNRDLATVSYDGVVLELLLPPYFGYIPISAFDGAWKNLASGVPASWSLELYGEVEAVALSYEHELDGYRGETRVYVAREGYAMLGAEFFLDGHMVMEMAVSDFSPQ